MSRERFGNGGSQRIKAEFQRIKSKRWTKRKQPQAWDLRLLNQE
jgi:hypothetical protein